MIYLDNAATTLKKPDCVVEAVMKALGTMGNYASLPSAAKIIFTLDMFLGRVEIFPILIVFSMIGNRQK